MEVQALDRDKETLLKTLHGAMQTVSLSPISANGNLQNTAKKGRFNVQLSELLGSNGIKHLAVENQRGCDSYGEVISKSSFCMQYQSQRSLGQPKAVMIDFKVQAHAAESMYLSNANGQDKKNPLFDRRVSPRLRFLSRL